MGTTRTQLPLIHANIENTYRIVLVGQVTELVTSSVLFELKLLTRKNNKLMSKYVWNYRIYWK